MKKYYILGGLALILFILGLNVMLTSGSDSQSTETVEQQPSPYSGLGK